MWRDQNEIYSCSLPIFTGPSHVLPACRYLLSFNDLYSPQIIVLRSTRLFDEEVKAKMGVVECAKHDLVQPFSVLYEKTGMY